MLALTGIARDHRSAERNARPNPNSPHGRFQTKHHKHRSRKGDTGEERLPRGDSVRAVVPHRQ